MTFFDLVKQRYSVKSRPAHLHGKRKDLSETVRFI